VAVRQARAGYLAPDGLCRICAACVEQCFLDTPR